MRKVIHDNEYCYLQIDVTIKEVNDKLELSFEVVNYDVQKIDVDEYEKFHDILNIQQSNFAYELLEEVWNDTFPWELEKTEIMKFTFFKQE